MARRLAASALAGYVFLCAATVHAQDGETSSHVARDQERLEDRLRELEAAKADYEDATREIHREQERLHNRIDQLETTGRAHEDATRSIIREAFGSLGSKINEWVIFGGTLETITGWSENFQGKSESEIRLDTLELDFEIQVNDWSRGYMILEYVDGQEHGESQTDRVGIDAGSIVIGNPQRWWPFAAFGRMVLPFGISTGDPVADVLSLEDPLTVEVFETREDAILLGVAFPTPPQRPPQTIPAPPRVRPLVLQPLVGKFAQLLGYKPRPARPLAAAFETLAPDPPPFNLGIYFFDGKTTDRFGDSGLSEAHFGATMGYRTRGKCQSLSERDNESELPSGSRWRVLCPWTLDVKVDFSRSVFDTRFLEAQYKDFLDEIGFIPGFAVSATTNLGPVSLVMEWNGAVKTAKFVDGESQSIAIAPSAWQISLGYQFDWNPQVEAIGGQGTYITIGYSQSSDLAGVDGMPIDGKTERVGFVPRRRYVVGVGEWIMDNVRVAIDYAHVVDYSKSAGGTGKSANGVSGQLTFEW